MEHKNISISLYYISIETISYQFHVSFTLKTTFASCKYTYNYIFTSWTLFLFVMNQPSSKII